MDDESLEKIVAAALARLRISVECGTPFMGQCILEWLGSLYPNHSLQEYCTHPDAFPLLLTPWWWKKLYAKHWIPLSNWISFILR
jgi:hypothetical protein